MGRIIPLSTSRREVINHETSKHKRFIYLWCEAYQREFECRYFFQGGKDGAWVKRLLGSVGMEPEEIVEVARQAWANGTEFWCKQAATISGFASHLNEIRMELRNLNGHPKVNGKGQGWGELQRRVRGGEDFSTVLGEMRRRA